ncbi:MAG: uracil-DNA glycosylase [Pseudomonadota bacterium]
MVDEASRLRYLEAMGIDVWVPRNGSVATQPPRGVPRKAETGQSADTGAVSLGLHETRPLVRNEDTDSLWRSLEAQVAACQQCPLHKTRTQTVFGSGSHTASWMIIGEAPGASEDRQGQPFVGSAGKLLTEMLRAIGLRRDEVFIANMLKCRPPNNRDPKPDEIDACETYLKRQLALIKPRIILAVGRIAAQNLLKTSASLGQLRGKVHYYDTIPVVVSYHPAYLLRSLLDKRKAWQDLQLAMKIFQGNAFNSG